MSKPIFVVVHTDARLLGSLADNLRRCFGTDYGVVAERNADDALATVGRLAITSGEVALLIAPAALPGMTGPSSWVRAHELQPSAKRVGAAGGAVEPDPRHLHPRWAAMHVQPRGLRRRPAVVWTRRVRTAHAYPQELHSAGEAP